MSMFVYVYVCVSGVSLGVYVYMSMCISSNFGTVNFLNTGVDYPVHLTAGVQSNRGVKGK